MTWTRETMYMEDKLILQILRRLGVQDGDKLVVQRGDELVSLDLMHVRQGKALTDNRRRVHWPKGTPRPHTTRAVGFELEDGVVKPPRTRGDS